jgi:opacity protein-like surface antigen
MICANFNSALTRARPMLRGALAGLWLAIAGVALATGPASAADIDDSFLRGAFGPTLKPYNNWDGFYFGVDLGRGQSQADFGDGVSKQIAHILRDSTLENEGQVSSWSSVPSGHGSGNIWGAFVGENWQMDELVLGIEGAYHKASSKMSAAGSDSLTRIFTTSDGYVNTVTLNTSGSFQLKDYGTFRGRAGYSFGQFLPYAGLGMSVARVSYFNQATVRVTAPAQGGNPAVNFGPITELNARSNAIAYGANFALGMDVTLLPNLFLRAEWEYIAFAPIDGIRANVNAIRAGIGAKF